MTASAQSSAAVRKILMTIDAAGGVWRYGMDLAAGLRPFGFETVFACFGPLPTAAQVAEAEALGALRICEAPLDWMVENEAALRDVPDLIAEMARSENVDLIHLNLPSQAACLNVRKPVVVTAHSCVCTWFEAVRGHGIPNNWQWQLELNRTGFGRADTVLMPSESHAALSQQVYGPIDRLQVVFNATRVPPAADPKSEFVFAAGRWWDDGKNGTVLDAAAPQLGWPLVMAGSNQGPSGQYLPLRNVEHRGELDHTATMALMRDAAIVVSPSLYEPFGLAALEAARTASALVLADIPTYRELWDGVALFADPHDPDSFAEAINLLARNTDLCRTLGRQAQVRSLTFTPEMQAAAVSAVYRQILSPTQAITTAEQA
jgi:glycosyltransferase involved in cell wall biosynthesis